MFIVLFIAFALILAAGIFVMLKWGNQLYREDREWTFFTLIAIGGCGCIIIAILTLIFSITYSNARVIDQRIAMYETENQQIEERIESLVDNYMAYESDTFEKVDRGDDTIALVSLFPELKSDTLVERQIEVYMSNNKQIKELKEEELKYKVYAWWLFFGGD